MGDSIFTNLFVLEAANNHWGSVERGRKLIRAFGTVARYNSVRAAIKLQFRDVETFIHQDFRGNQELRYVKKTEATKLNREQLGELVAEVRAVGCIPMATPFDETSVDLCVDFDFPIIKVASSDVNDWPLLERIAHYRRPVIVSSGGASEKDLDDVVAFFEHRSIPLAINHCVSLYPSEDAELELNQIDYLKDRYPGHVIGFSTHEYHDWHSSMFISYAKGARTWERHVDVDLGDYPVSPYCSTPEQIDEWFRAFHKAVEMCGGSGSARRVITTRETEYLDALVRGVYARRDIDAGYEFNHQNFAEDFYLAVPLRKSQLSCREVLTGQRLAKPILVDEPLSIDHVAGPYRSDSVYNESIRRRGL